jgi:hypothetical protein
MLGTTVGRPQLAGATMAGRLRRALCVEAYDRMGVTMFDFVNCDWPLPDATFQNKMFETRSLGNLGRRYTITKQGRLVRRLSEELTEYKGPRYSDDVELPLHGELRISSRWTTPGEPRLSLVFRFRKGQVQWVRRAEEVDSFHDLLWRACKKLPGDYRPWGELEREDPKAPQGWWPDCSAGCRHYLVLQDAGDQQISFDWGVCINPRSHRFGLLTFEHQGCPAFEYEVCDED